MSGEEGLDLEIGVNVILRIGKHANDYCGRPCSWEDED